MRLIHAIATVGGLTLLSRVFGFIRDILTAAFLGAGPVADAFFLALKLPNFFRRITAEGAFSVAFVPQYAGALEKNGPEDARRYAQEAMAVMLGVMIPFTIVAIVLMPWIIHLVAPGFDHDGPRYDLAVELSRITFPYILMMSVVALLGGILNSIDRFAPFAAAPIFFNICIIWSLLFLSPVVDTPGHAMAWGVALSGVVQLLWMVWFCLKFDVMPSFQLPRITPDMKKLFRLMGPAVLGAGVVQINIFIDVVIASFLPTGSIAFLYYADRLNQLPLSVVGIAIATALLPMLSRVIKARDHDRTNELFNKSLRFGLVLALPAAAALIVVPAPLLTVLFERGAFDSTVTSATAYALMGYAVGLPAYVLLKVVNATFYAHEDTVTPVKAAIAGTILNTVLSLLLLVPLQHAGIALATGIAGWAQLFFVSYRLKTENFVQLADDFWRICGKIMAATCGMCGVLMFFGIFLGGMMSDGGVLQKIFGLVALVGAGKVSYLYFIHTLDVFKMGEFRALLRRDGVGR